MSEMIPDVAYYRNHVNRVWRAPDRPSLDGGIVIPEPVADRGPKAFNTYQEALSDPEMHLPTDARYVVWQDSWGNPDMEYVFGSILSDTNSNNDILVLPERDQPYTIDLSEGFRARGVGAVLGYDDVRLPIISRYRNSRDARGWFSAGRARRGILGLGPDAKIQMINPGGWQQEQQVQDSGSVYQHPYKPGVTFTSPGRIWYNTAGATQVELRGGQEKIFDAAHPRSYWGNFTFMPHLDLGGVGFHAIATGGDAPTFERINFDAAWHGYLGIPNGEMGAISIAGVDSYYIGRCILNTRLPNGFRTGSSPIMINNATSGRIEHIRSAETYAGMLTLWDCRGGKHTLVNVDAQWTRPGINLEKLGLGFELEWIGGTLWSNYQNRSTRTPKPSDIAQFPGGLHISLNSPGGSSVITFRGVDFDESLNPGLNIQGWGGTSNKQTVDTIKAYDVNGNPIPVRYYS